MTLNLGWLRAIAELAKPGDRHDDGTGQWAAYFTVHGDPYVVEAGHGLTRTIATVATAPDDYGRARAEFIAAVDPATVLAMLDVIDDALIACHAYFVDAVQAENPGVVHRPMGALDDAVRALVGPAEVHVAIADGLADGLPDRLREQWDATPRPADQAARARAADALSDAVDLLLGAVDALDAPLDFDRLRVASIAYHETDP